MECYPRPAIAVAVFLVADWLQVPDNLLATRGLPRAVIWMAGFGAVVLLAEWRLAGQSAGQPRRRI